MALTSRQRVLCALTHEEPDRVPLDFGGTQTGILVQPYNELKSALGLETPTQVGNLVLGLARIEEPVLERFAIDFRHILPRMPATWKFELRADDSFYDDWGIRWHRPPGSYYYDMVYAPLRSASLEALENYRWPNPLDPGRVSGTAEEAAELHTTSDYAIEAGLVGLWESAWFLVGMEDWLVAVYKSPDFVEALLDGVLETLKKMHTAYLDEVGPYVDLVTLWDDYGAQCSTLISPSAWRRLVKPRLAELVSTLKSRTRAYIGLHCCGAISALLDDLVEVGIQVVNPVQVSARGMDPTSLKRRYGKNLTFWGAIDSQKLLPGGSEAEVRHTVRSILADLGPGGGYILAGVHNIQPGVPARNIIAMYDTALQSGRYPLNLESEAYLEVA